MMKSGALSNHITDTHKRIDELRDENRELRREFKEDMKKIADKLDQILEKAR